jgi:hypothetical protein
MTGLTKKRTTLPGLIFVLAVAVMARPTQTQGQTLDHPRTLNANGTAAIAKVSEASRVALLGTVPLYSVAIYADRLDRAQLASPDVAKALRILITFKPDLRRSFPVDWRRELVPNLEPAGRTTFLGLITPLQQGDHILVEYTPQKGATIRVNDGVAASVASHDLMLTFLDHWLGERPVSEDMKRQLLGTTGGLH